jgi:hypothetical protein
MKRDSLYNSDLDLPFSRDNTNVSAFPFIAFDPTPFNPSDVPMLLHNPPATP